MKLVLLLILIISWTAFFTRILTTFDKSYRFILSILLSYISISVFQYWENVSNISAAWMMSAEILVLIIFNIKNSRLANETYSENKLSLLYLFPIIIGSFLFYRYTLEFGSWDGWAIWNLHAKFSIYPEWEQQFVNQLNWSHPDYPLMIPMIITYLSKSMLSFSPELTSIFHYSIYFLMLAVITLSKNLDTIPKLVLLLLFSFDRNFVATSASQYADTLLSLIMLFGVITYFKLNKLKNNNFLFVYGLFISSSIWVKNEGMVFFMVYSAILILYFRTKMSFVLKYLIGTIPVLLTYVHFKTNYAPVNELFLFENFNFNSIGLIFTNFFINSFLVFPAIFVFIVYTFIKSSKKNLKAKFPMYLLLLTVLLVYLSSYLITPYDVEWHMNNSLSRLIYQIYPAFLVLILYENNIEMAKVKT